MKSTLVFTQNLFKVLCVHTSFMGFRYSVEQMVIVSPDITK